MSFLGGPSNATNIPDLAPSLHEKVAERFVYRYDPNTSKLVSLMALSLSLASLSVLAALVALYMFVRMRRAFHHE